MKKIFLILTAVLFCSNILYSQIDDLTIAQNLINKNKSEIDTILKSLNLEYYKTYETGNTLIFYLVHGIESIRSWTLTFEDLKKIDSEGYVTILARDICTEVFIRFHHTNLNDLRDFFAIVLPPNDKVFYEKSLGKDVSHLKIANKKK